jgi:hypothetical protein
MYEKDERVKEISIERNKEKWKERTGGKTGQK